jgi:pimeloyl-ACP methyl ester carboxylesterase
VADDHPLCEGALAVAGYRIHFREQGAGPLVLLLHGFPETARSWRLQMPALAAAGYRAVAIDLLGYGRSSRPVRIDEYRITNLVRIVAGTIAALGAERAVLIGHDWGAPIAWTTAWTRPDLVDGVIAAGVPFGGRGIWGLPGSPFGERRPSEIDREIAGPDLVFYQEYFQLPGQAEREFDADPAGWLRDAFYSFSAAAQVDAPPPDLAALSADPSTVVPLLRQTGLCQAPGARMSDRFRTPERLPDWLPSAELAAYAAEFERTGLSGALNYYRCCDLDWELLEAYADLPLTPPALFVGADRDAPTIWAREAIARMGERVTDLRGVEILADCGHWIQQEQSLRFEELMLGFLDELSPASPV